MRYSENRSRQLGTTRNLFQVLGFAIEGDDTAATVVAPGHSQLSSNVSVEDIVLHRDTSSTVNGEYFSAMRVASACIREVKPSQFNNSLFEGSNILSRDDSNEKQLFGKRWSPSKNSKRDGHGVGTRYSLFLCFLIPIFSLTGYEEPERVYTQFSDSVISTTNGVPNIERDCTKLVLSLL